MAEEIFAKMQIKKVRENYEISILYKIFYNEKFRKIADIEDPWEKKKILEYVHKLRFLETEKNKCMYFNIKDFGTRSGKLITRVEAETGVSVVTKFQDIYIQRVPKIIFELKRVFGNNLIVEKEKIV